MSSNSLSSIQNVNHLRLQIKDPYEAKYQLLINKRKGLDLKQCNNVKAFIEYLNNMDDIYENIEE